MCSSASALRSGPDAPGTSSSGSAAARRRPVRSPRPRSASRRSSPRGRRTTRSRPRCSSPTEPSRVTSPTSSGSSGSSTDPKSGPRWPPVKHKGSTHQTRGTLPFLRFLQLPSLASGGYEGHQEQGEGAMTRTISLIIAIAVTALVAAGPAFGQGRWATLPQPSGVAYFYANERSTLAAQPPVEVRDHGDAIAAQLALRPEGMVVL